MEETTPLEAPELVEYLFEFRGNTGEFFKIWAVNTLLTIVTLGFFSPWAKVRTRRYFNGNTFLDGGNFDYHANPWAIFLARVLVFGAIGVVAYWAGEDILKKAVYSTLFVVFLPWAYVRGLAFNARNTSFSGLRFSFRKTYGGIYIIYLPVFVAVLAPAFYLVINYQGNYPDIKSFLFELSKIETILWSGVLLFFPLMTRALHRFRACGHSFGTMSFGFKAPSIWRYYFGYYADMFLFISLYFILIAIAIAIGISGPSFFSFFWGVAVAAICISVAHIISVAVFYFRLFWDNLIFPNGRVQCNFTVSQFAFKILTVNFFAIIFSLGLLYPWAKIRRARYLAEHIKIIAPVGALQEVIATHSKKEGALGEELTAVEGFDFDIGLI